MLEAAECRVFGYKGKWESLAQPRYLGDGPLVRRCRLVEWTNQLNDIRNEKGREYTKA